VATETLEALGYAPAGFTSEHCRTGGDCRAPADYRCSVEAPAELSTSIVPPSRIFLARASRQCHKIRAQSIHLIRLLGAHLPLSARESKRIRPDSAAPTRLTKCARTRKRVATLE